MKAFPSNGYGGNSGFPVEMCIRDSPYTTTDKVSETPGSGTTVADKLYKQFNGYTFNEKAVGVKQIASVKLDKDDNVRMSLS